MAWYCFVRATYGLTHHPELSIGLLMLLCAFFFARILAWYWTEQQLRLCIFLLLFICATPHMIYFAGSLYPDAIFAVSATALLFELWIITNRRHASGFSLLVIALAFPFAVFSRANGIVFIASVAIAVFLIPKGRRWALVAIVAVWCLFNFAGTRAHHSTAQDATYPLVRFETAKLFQPRAMNDLWNTDRAMNDPWVVSEPKLSARTKEILLSRTTIEALRAYSDPTYWDMLAYHRSGPTVLQIPAAKKKLIGEFFRYNFWHNLPEIVASRVNVFLTAALAEGGFPALDYANFLLTRTQIRSSFRLFGHAGAEQALRQIQRTSYEWRWILWTPWLGFALLRVVLLRGWRRGDQPALLVAIPVRIQLLAIAAFASAGEYRYLLLFFTIPLALFPLLGPRTHAGASSRKSATAL